MRKLVFQKIKELLQDHTENDGTVANKLQLGRPGPKVNLLSVASLPSQYPVNLRSGLRLSSLSWKLTLGLRSFMGHGLFRAKTGTAGHPGTVDTWTLW